jgi:hypothetical protein
MGWFYDEASREAARHFGRRFHRWYLALHVLRALWPVVAILGIVGAVTVAGWAVRTYTAAVPWPSVLRLAALLPLAVLIGWIAVQILTGAGIRHRAAGRHSRIPALAVVAVLLLLAASMLID